MCKVSIIVPVYNVENYLRQAMDSALNQTLTDIEVICVNDGATDSSPEILREYDEADTRVRVIHQKNGGYGKGMNKGIDAARGEYIAILEPDDYIEPRMMEDLYNTAKEYDLDLVKSDFCRFTTDENGVEHRDYVAIDRRKELYGRVFCPAVDQEAFRATMNTWTGIYRRDWVNEHNIRHHETPGAAFQDNGFYFKTFAHCRRGMIINKAYYMNRRDNPNSSVKSKEKVYCMNIEYDYIRDFLKEDPERWETFKYWYWWKKYHNYMFTYDRIDDKYKKEYMTRMSREYRWAMIQKELSPDVFTELEWQKLDTLINNSDGFENTLKSSKLLEFMKPYVPEQVKRLIFRVMAMKK